MIPTDAKCQETFGMIGQKYLECGKPAVMQVQHRGRDEGPYYMCLECGTHNADNRNAEVIDGTPEVLDALARRRQRQKSR